MSNQPPHISNLKKCSASSVGCTPSRLPLTVPRVIPVMLAILVIPCFARLDRDFDFRAVTCPLDRAQDAPIRFIRNQSQQLSIFLVRLLKGESPVSHSARVTHGISTPTDVRAAELAALAQSAQIGVALTQLYPAISITGTFGGAASTAN